MSNLRFVSVSGIHMLQWHDMGITDPEDLGWLMEFYHGQREWTPVLVLGAVSEAQKFRTVIKSKKFLDKLNRT